MSNFIQSIGIVGGGSAGLVTALILKTRFPDINVEVIRSNDIGTIGVGEGSTEHWADFIDFVGIDYKDLIKECDATFKSGIMFRNWGDQDYLQSITTGFNFRKGKYAAMYAHKISQNCDPKDLVSPHAWDSKINTWFINQEDTRPAVQFHFNTNKLNVFLTKFAEQRGIKFHDDEIIEVNVDDQGIRSLVSNHQTYKYDFYIDCSGFKKLLISQLGAKWKSYGKYLKMKSAIVFPCEMSKEIPMWTEARALKYGWMFRIPVYDRFGNGYIYDSDYITAEQAQQEVEEVLGFKVSIAKHITFDPGMLEKSWIKNCCAVGLSSSFVEPLEATSIGTSIQQTFLLADYLIGYNSEVIDYYNKTLEGILENIRDFIVLHYITNREDSEFWKDIKHLKIPNSLAEKLQIWKKRLPSENDFYNVSEYRLFTDFHHILVMYGLHLFNIEAIKTEYNLNVSYNDIVNLNNLEKDILQLRCQTIPHKTMLDIIRNIRNENY